MSGIECQQCGKRAAIIHITELINGEKKEIHLCEQCAKKKKIPLQTITTVQDLNEFLTNVMDAANAGQDDELASLRCPECGMTFGEFRASTRFGCPNDYEAFRKGVDPLLQRIHGTTEHRGKAAADASAKRRTTKLAALRKELKKAVAEEAYERAARIRDQIYALKKDLGDAAE